MTETDPRAAAGRSGERIARRYLESLGYRVLAVRWRCRLGEIDLIARDPSGEGTIVFIEVRTRSACRHGSPQETVRFPKQQRLARLASAWLSGAAGEASLPCRFDVVAIAPPADEPDGDPEILHLVDAFRVPVGG
jgi:putative endonuclease